MAQRKHDPWGDPVKIGFTYDGWSLVEIVPYHHPRKHPLMDDLEEVRFRSSDGEKMHRLKLAGRPFTIREAKIAVFDHMRRQQEERLSLEYARMC